MKIIWLAFMTALPCEVVINKKKHLPDWQMLFDDYQQDWVTWVYSGIPRRLRISIVKRMI